MWHIPFYEMLRGHSLDPELSALDRAAVRVDTGITVLGRALFATVFLASGVGHFMNHEAMTGYAAAAGVPLPGVMIPLTGAMILLGGLSVLLGYRTRLGAWLLVVFLLPVTLMMHRFWGLDDPAQSAAQMVHFMKNLGLIGAALLLTRFGSGPGSLTRD